MADDDADIRNLTTLTADTRRALLTAIEDATQHVDATGLESLARAYAVTISAQPGRKPADLT